MRSQQYDGARNAVLSLTMKSLKGDPLVTYSADQTFLACIAGSSVVSVSSDIIHFAENQGWDCDSLSAGYLEKISVQAI